jgi:hypothetical protein
MCAITSARYRMSTSGAADVAVTDVLDFGPVRVLAVDAGRQHLFGGR